MTGAPALPGSPGTVARGIDSHRRSLLVWPRLLDESAVALVRFVATTGARLIAFDEPLPAELAGGLPPVVLDSWCDDSAPRPREVPASGDPQAGTPSSGRWSAIVALHRACGLVPLPPAARVAEEWRHAWLADSDAAPARPDGSPARPDGRPGGIVATASVQRVANPIGRAEARHLVSCVATQPSERRRGAAARCLAAVRASAGGPCAAITETAAAARFFEHAGWRRCQAVWLYRWQ